MPMLRRAFIAITPVVMVGACGGGVDGGATSASRLTEPGPGELMIGRTTSDDARRILGTPIADRSHPASDPFPEPPREFGPTVLANLPQFRPVSASGQARSMMFIESRGPGYRDGLLVLRFWNDRLVEHGLLGGIAPDHFLVASNAADGIVRTRTTEAEIRSRFGAPTGVAVYPRIASPDQRMLSFMGSRFASSGQQQLRMLYVLLDRRGVVVDYALETSTIVVLRTAVRPVTP